MPIHLDGGSGLQICSLTCKVLLAKFTRLLAGKRIFILTEKEGHHMKRSFERRPY